MAFVKVVKNKAYFKRYQVKYRRRREGKTDYNARRKLVAQEKNKYDAPKYRLIVRISNKTILAQIAHATVQGDLILESANSKELQHYGIKAGATNYSSAYAVGLLLARRVLKKLKIDDEFKGLEQATGEEYHVEENFDSRRPFKALLDIGIVSTTTGHRVFGVMKGACDGGLHIPHSNTRFAGFSGGKEGSYDAEKHRERIFGIHVANYMKLMQEEAPDKFETHFSQYIKAGVSADNIEAMYKNAHAKIRSNPERVKTPRAHEPVHIRQGSVIKTSKGSYTRRTKLTCEQRKERVMKKMALVAEGLTSENAIPE